MEIGTVEEEIVVGGGERGCRGRCRWGDDVLHFHLLKGIAVAVGAEEGVGGGGRG